MSAVPKPGYYRMTLGEFRRSNFVGRAPSLNTIKAMIKDGDWLGEVTPGGRWFIFVDANSQPIPGKPQTVPMSTGNADADAIILRLGLNR